MAIYKVDDQGNRSKQINDSEGHLVRTEMDSPENIEELEKTEPETTPKLQNLLDSQPIILISWWLLIAILSVIITTIFQTPKIQLTFNINDVYIWNETMERIIEEKVTTLKEELLKNTKKLDTQMQSLQDMEAKKSTIQESTSWE